MKNIVFFSKRQISNKTSFIHGVQKPILPYLAQNIYHFCIHIESHGVNVYLEMVPKKLFSNARLAAFSRLMPCDHGHKVG